MILCFLEEEGSEGENGLNVLYLLDIMKGDY